MPNTLTAVFRQVPEGFIGFIEEIPGANTQAATLEEARANLREAAAELIEEHRSSIAEAVKGGKVIRESFAFDFDASAIDETFAPRNAA